MCTKVGGYVGEYIGLIFWMYWSYIRDILGLERGYIRDVLGLYQGYFGVILGVYWDDARNGKDNGN